MTHPVSMLQTPAPHTVASTPPLLQRLIDQFGARWVDADAQAAVLVEAGDCVLFIAGDPVRFPECLDVAVVLPELQKHFSGRFRVAVLRPENEDEVARRYAANRRPALVFLRDGRYVTTVFGMQDWDDYIVAVAQALDAPVTRVPGIGIPVVAASSACN